MREVWILFQKDSGSYESIVGVYTTIEKAEAERDKTAPLYTSRYIRWYRVQ